MAIPDNIRSVNVGNNVFENLYVYGIAEFSATSLFKGDATFEKDVTIEGEFNVDSISIVRRLRVGENGQAFNVDAITEKVGIFTATPQQKLQFNSDEDSTVVITGLGTVGIGTVNPGVGVNSLNDSTQGKLSLDLETISVRRNLYDSVGYPGANGAYLQRDEFGIRWTDVEPSFTEGIFVQDEGVYIPTAGAAQSFTVLNFRQINSFGLGTDTTIPVPNTSNPLFIADIQTQDLWGYSGIGANASIYRMTNVGIGSSVPGVTLDVVGGSRFTGIVTIVGNTFIDQNLDVDGATTLNNTLDVDGATTLNSTLDVDGASTLNSTLDVDGGTTLNSTLDVDGATTLNSTLDVDGASTLNSTLDVDGATTLNNTLDVDGTSLFRNTIELDSSLIDLNGSVGPASKDYRLASVGTGVSWRPAGVETQNTIWVTKDGNDSNSGLLEGDAKATVGAAATVAQEGDTIVIRPGIYTENNPIGLRTDVTVTGQDLRLVTIVPSNVTKDVFHVRRGCLVENLNFAGSSVSVAHTGAAAIAFPPTEVADQANTGYIQLGPTDEGSSGRWRSPYIRNCTNFMTKSIGMKIDGNHATASVPGADLKSMVCDSFTQYNENGIGVSITNNGYAQLVSIFTINCDIGIYAATGGSCDLTNSNSSFGNFGLYAVGLGSTEYTGLVNVNTSAEVDTIVGSAVSDTSGTYRRPYDGQAVWFKINLDNYPDAVGSGRITAPLQRLSSVTVTNGGSGYSQANPPSVIVRDSDDTLEPKGPQGIIAEASATIGDDGSITEIDVINSGRNYLSTQNIVIDIDGNTGLATAVMEPIYFTISEATENVSGISTITFNEFVPYELFQNDPIDFKRISRILTSSHSFEYIGTGTSINTSLPFQGAVPIKANEVVAIDGAQIPFTSTDQKGNFDIGSGIQVDQTTSTIRGRDFSRAIQAEVTPLILALR